MSLSGSSILVTGHNGLLGSAIVRELQRRQHKNILTVARQKVDWTQQTQVHEYFRSAKPQVVIHCAARVGGIQDNLSSPADFIDQNTLMQTHIIQACKTQNVSKLVFFGSNCMYPTQAPQPLVESSLLTGAIEPSNLAYGISKASGMVQIESYRKQHGLSYYYIIPASLYGPQDNFSLTRSHVTPALLLKFHLAKKSGQSSIQLWGTGQPRRELLFSDDAAKGVLTVLESYDPNLGPINLGTDVDHSIQEIAEALKEITGYRGLIEFDSARPDGSLKKLLDSTRAKKLQYRPTTKLEDGLQLTYEWLTHAKDIRGISQEQL